jgi:hypothetical protein
MGFCAAMMGRWVVGNGRRQVFSGTWRRCKSFSLIRWFWLNRTAREILGLFPPHSQPTRRQGRLLKKHQILRERLDQAHLPERHHRRVTVCQRQRRHWNRRDHRQVGRLLKRRHRRAVQPQPWQLRLRPERQPLRQRLRKRQRWGQQRLPFLHPPQVAAIPGSPRRLPTHNHEFKIILDLLRVD